MNSNASIFVDIGYDWPFMLSLFKFTKTLSSYKISIASEVKKKRRIWVKNYYVRIDTDSLTIENPTIRMGIENPTMVIYS